jgi:hypothetical protein
MLHKSQLVAWSQSAENKLLTQIHIHMQISQIICTATSATTISICTQCFLFLLVVLNSKKLFSISYCQSSFHMLFSSSKSWSIAESLAIAKAKCLAAQMQLLIKNAALLGDGKCCGFVISSDHLHRDAQTIASADGVYHSGTHSGGKPHHADEDAR